MSDLKESKVENIDRELARALSEFLSWKWDQRFRTALGEFGVEKRDGVQAILRRHLGATWDSSNVGNAPNIVRTIDDEFGGLWPGQLLFTSDPKREALMFCTWWPWGDGQSISIRVGLSVNKELSDSERAEKIALLKGWFGV